MEVLADLRRDAHVPPGLLRGLAPRLDTFLRPFVAALTREEQRDNAGQYVRGLLSNLGAKTAEAIAYLHDQDRQGLQKFVGQSPWDHRPLLAELARQVGAELGEPDAVLAFDPSAFAKKGDRSVGVQRTANARDWGSCVDLRAVGRRSTTWAVVLVPRLKPGVTHGNQTDHRRIDRFVFRMGVTGRPLLGNPSRCRGLRHSRG